MTFKYRFIFSFVLLEVFFILLIVLTNFMAIKNSTNNLINQTIESNVELLEQLIKVPLSIKDTATLDNFFLNSDRLEYVNTIIVLDNESNILTTKYNFTKGKVEDILEFKGKKYLNYGDEHYVLFQKEIFDEEFFLGSLFIIFDISKNYQTIADNKILTYFIVLIEIIISTILSYIVGHKLTEMLTNLTDVAKEIGHNKNPTIPYQNRTDEIGILAKSMYAMLQDLKERSRKLKDMGIELRRQKNDLVQANVHKDEFLANMSHELKTPLNSINVISSVMMKNKQGKLDEKQVKNLKIINSCGNDLLYLINDILDISKIEAGELLITVEKIDIHDLFSELADMFEPQIAEKKLNFKMEIDSELTYVHSDSMRIKQIVKNLVNNSIKFTNSGDISVFVKNKDNMFEIIVKDDGIGISEEKMPFIFDRFKQADGTINRKFGGTGLGLAITNELTKMLGGDIHVISKEGVGTTFMITLSKDISDENSVIKEYASSNKSINVSKYEKPKDKLTSINLEQIEKNEPKEEILIKTNIDTKSLKVLLLNQDPLSFMQVVIELKKEYNLEQVSTLEQFKAKTKNEKYDLIIIDTSKFMLSDINLIISHIDSKIALIVVDKSVLSKIENIKYDLVVEKPFDKKFLTQEIRKTLV